jgi:hypothetical protein
MKFKVGDILFDENGRKVKIVEVDNFSYHFRYTTKELSAVWRQNSRVFEEIYIKCGQPYNSIWNNLNEA